MTTIYRVTPVEETNTGSAYYPTKREAMHVARAVAKGGSTSHVTRITIEPKGWSRRKLFAALLNNEGFATEQETIAEFRAHDQDFDDDGKLVAVRAKP